jgi:hypothetical protein
MAVFNKLLDILRLWDSIRISIVYKILDIKYNKVSLFFIRSYTYSRYIEGSILSQAYPENL